MPTKLEANASFRKPRLVFLVLALALIFSVVCVGGVCGADVWEGSGTEDDPYRIYTVDDLKSVAGKINGNEWESYCDKHFRLMNDIVLNDETKYNNVFDGAGNDKNILNKINNNNLNLWTPIGIDTNHPFKGTFDGSGHSIDKAIIAYKSGSQSGLFGYVKSGSIKNLNVLDIALVPDGNANGANIGSIVGLLHDGSISDCAVEEEIFVSTSNEGNLNFIIGGLVGKIVKTDDDDMEVISDSEITNYLFGNCFVTTLTTGYSKSWGLICGSPLIGSLSSGNSGSGGTTDDSSAIYTVQYFKRLDIHDDYVKISNDDENKFVGVVGQTVIAEYEIPDERYFLSEDSVISGVVGNGKEGGGPLLVLKVYYDIIYYQVTIPSELIISEDRTGSMGISVSDLRIPKTSTVRVYIDGDFKLDYQDSQGVSPLRYEVWCDLYSVPLLTGSFVGHFSMSNQNPIKLRATVLDRAPYSGTYTDTLTFTYGLDLIK